MKKVQINIRGTIGFFSSSLVHAFMIMMFKFCEGYGIQNNFLCLEMNCHDAKFNFLKLKTSIIPT